MKLLDLFCGAGGCSKGYNEAGFDVTGVDINNQKRYPFKFIQTNAIEYLSDHYLEYDVIHASPPCQKFSTMTQRWEGQTEKHQDLITITRELLKQTNKPYVIENVPNAPLINPMVLCGSMFGLNVRRHRLFESNIRLQPLQCQHHLQSKIVGVYGHAGGKSNRDGIEFGGTDEWRQAMGIDWMVGKELAQAIPPAYTKYVGEQILNYLINV